MASHAYNQTLAQQLMNSLGFIQADVAIDAPSMTAVTTNTATVAVAGLTPAHRCIFTLRAAPSSGGVVVAGAYCAAAGTLTVQFSNPSAGTVDLSSVNGHLLAFPAFGA